VARSKSQLLAQERQRQIVTRLRERGSVKISELSELFAVTDETIRRDLKRLDQQGLLERSHGGAVDAPAREEWSFVKRLLEHQREKAAIARRAVAFVQDGSTIILDSGTTMAHFARALSGRRDLVVITNAVTNAVELMKGSSATVVLTGGVVRPTTLGAVGDLAVSSLSELHVDQTFLAIQSVSVRGGLTYPSFDEVAVKRAMIAAAGEVTLLADSSKFGRESLVKVAPLSVLTRVITTPGVDAEIERHLIDLGIELIVVEPPVVEPPAAEPVVDPGPEFATSLDPDFVFRSPLSTVDGGTP
jgi:DeoR/GlpR family transcriptional regulator of sugar metabolism